MSKSGVGKSSGGKKVASESSAARMAGKLWKDETWLIEDIGHIFHLDADPYNYMDRTVFRIQSEKRISDLISIIHDARYKPRPANSTAVQMQKIKIGMVLRNRGGRFIVKSINTPEPRDRWHQIRIQIGGSYYIVSAVCIEGSVKNEFWPGSTIEIEGDYSKLVSVEIPCQKELSARKTISEQIIWMG